MFVQSYLSEGFYKLPSIANVLGNYVKYQKSLKIQKLNHSVGNSKSLSVVQDVAAWSQFFICRSQVGHYIF